VCECVFLGGVPPNLTMVQDCTVFGCRVRRTRESGVGRRDEGEGFYLSEVRGGQEVRRVHPPVLLLKFRTKEV
jgi:hypothetical protein